MDLKADGTRSPLHLFPYLLWMITSHSTHAGQPPQLSRSYSFGLQSQHIPCWLEDDGSCNTGKQLFRAMKTHTHIPIAECPPFLLLKVGKGDYIQTIFPESCGLLHKKNTRTFPSSPGSKDEACGKLVNHFLD